MRPQKLNTAEKDILIVSPHQSIYRDLQFDYNNARNSSNGFQKVNRKFVPYQSSDVGKFRSLNTKAMLDNLKKSMNIYGEVTTPMTSELRHEMMMYYDENQRGLKQHQDKKPKLKKEFESQKWNPESDDKSINYSQNPLLLEQQQTDARPQDTKS